MKLTSVLMISALNSGAGKTTIATGLMAALTKRGLNVAGAKVGPDYIDPTFHTLATGNASYNLDTFMTGRAGALISASRAAMGADILVVEGVMGLFDGTRLDTVKSEFELEPIVANPRALTGSTAEIAMLLGAPIVLVIDASGASDSIAASVLGARAVNPSLQIVGVIANRVAGVRHVESIRTTLAEFGIPLFGWLARSSDEFMPSRHLGLIPVQERPAESRNSVRDLVGLIEDGFDIDRLLLYATELNMPQFSPKATDPALYGTKIAIATGRAFTFEYVENRDILRELGAELVDFDPTTDEALPEAVSGLIIGGGYPEVYIDQIAENHHLLESIAAFASSGGVIWAECAGHMVLGASLDGKSLAGVHPGQAEMGRSLTLGYRIASTSSENPMFGPDEVFRAHEYHYSTMQDGGSDLRAVGRTGSSTSGYVSPTIFSTYMHLHLGGSSTAAARFLRAAQNRNVKGSR